MIRYYLTPLISLALLLAVAAGCDISSEPLPAYAAIADPSPRAVVYVGEPFAVAAEVESDGPVDSMHVRLRPAAPGAEALVLPVEVPRALRSGEGVLQAVLDTALTVQALPVEGVQEHLLMVWTYLSDGRRGTSSGIPVRVLERPAE